MDKFISTKEMYEEWKADNKENYITYEEYLRDNIELWLERGYAFYIAQ